MTKGASDLRRIEIALRLIEGEKISEESIMDEYNASIRTIFRDKAFLKAKFKNSATYHYRADNDKKLIYLDKESEIPFEEVLAIMKVLIGSRTFSRYELGNIEYDISQVLSEEDQLKLENVLHFNGSKYTAVHTSDNLLEDIAKLNDLIDSRTAINFDYKSSQVDGEEKKNRIALPLSLYFDNHYFYVTMFLPEGGKDGEGVTYPFRVDRFNKIEALPNHPIVVPREKIEDEETIRNKTYKLSSGNDISYIFKYSGYPQMALDQLPNSKIREKNNQPILDKNGFMTIEGHLSFNGALMWVLSQGSKVKVEYPGTLAERVQEELQKTLNLYKK